MAGSAMQEGSRASRKAAARAAILAAWAKWQRRKLCEGLAQTTRMHGFVLHFNERMIGCEPWVREAYPELTFSTLYRWLHPKTKPKKTFLQERYFRESAFDVEPLRGYVAWTRRLFPEVSVTALHGLMCKRWPDLTMPSVRSLHRHLKRMEDQK